MYIFKTNLILLNAFKKQLINKKLQNKILSFREHISHMLNTKHDKCKQNQSY